MIKRWLDFSVKKLLAGNRSVRDGYESAQNSGLIAQLPIRHCQFTNLNPRSQNIPATIFKQEASLLCILTPGCYSRDFLNDDDITHYFPQRIMKD